jgi:uncharacterized protein
MGGAHATSVKPLEQMPNRNAATAPELTVSVRELSRRPGTSRDVRLRFPAPPGLGTDVAGVPEGGEVSVELLLEAALEGILATGNVRATAQAECARCLEQVSLPVEATFQELFVYPERADAAQDAGDGSGDDLPLAEGDTLDLTAAVWDGIVLALPFRPLCREDCPGLCAECGARLEDEPDHAHRTVDPRWAVLEDLLEDEKEGR